MTTTEEREIWQSATAGQVQVRKFDVRGRLGAEVVGPGRKVHLTTHEREINQEMAATPDMDVFRNGTLIPIKLLDEASELAVASPNHLSDDELRAMFGTHWTKFDKRLSEISNPSTLQRLLEMTEEVDAKVRQVDAIKHRLAVVSQIDVTEVVSSAAPHDELVRSGIRAVTPR